MQVPYAPAPVRLGPYELLQRLATGGMAEIYVARREGPHGFSKRIALKRILPQLAADPEFVAMFIDEARVCAQLSHPNLVQVFDFGEEGCELYMAMELIEGTTAARMVRTASARGEPMATELALYVALSVCRGLAHAHEACDESGRPLGLVHRDVSPGNILVSNAGAVKLGDFGIARAAEFDRHTAQGQLKGKLGYMSPEQVTGREVDARSDQFAAGIVLAELLLARPLFSGTREMDVLVKIRDADLSVLDRYGRQIPQEVVALLRRSLSRRREDRFPTTRAYADALEEVVRRRRLNATAANLAEWLQRVGLVRASLGSGEHSIEMQAAIAGPSAKPSMSLALRQLKNSGSHLVARRAEAEVEIETDQYRDLTPTDPSPDIYRVALSDVPEALSLSALLDLFVTGRISGNTPVSRDGGPFIPAREHPELSRCCVASAARWDEAPVHLRSFSCPIRPAQLPGKLFELAVRRATGLLVAKQGELEKKVYFVEGIPEVTASNDPNELFGALLMTRGLAMSMEIEMALAMAPRYGGRLGDALVGLGVLRPMDLARAIVDHMRRRFIQLSGWKSGHLTFEDGTRHPGPDEDTLPEALHPLALITRGIVESYTEKELDQLLRPLEASPIFPVPRSPVSIVSLELAQPDSVVLHTTEGRQTMAELVGQALARGGCDRGAVLRGIFVGLSCGALVSPAWPPSEVRESLPTLPDK